MLRGREFHNFLIYRIIRDNVYCEVRLFFKASDCVRPVRPVGTCRHLSAGCRRVSAPLSAPVGTCRRVSAHAGQGCPCRARRAGPGVGALSNPLMQVPLAPLGGEAAGRAGTRARAPGTSLRERRPLVPASTDPRAPCRPSLAGGASRADALSSHALAAAEAHQGTGRVGHACGYELRVYLRGRSAWDIPGALLRDQIRNSAKLRCTIVPA